MKVLRNTFLLLLAAAGLTSCGGGGGQSHSAFGGVGPDTISISAQPPSVTTNSFTSLTVTVQKYDGSPENDGTVVNATLSPASIGSITGNPSDLTGGNVGGTTATNKLAGGKAVFVFNSTNQTGTATVSFSVAAASPGTGQSNATSKSININVTGGNTQDPRLQLTATTRVLPLNPLIGLAERGPNYVNNYPGSPYIAEVTATWRRTNGQLVSGTLKANTSIAPTTVATFSELDDGSTAFQGLKNTPPDAEGNEFLTLLGSGPVNVTGGVGTIFVHSGDVPGTATLTVTAVDPDTSETISSQLTFTVVGSTSPGLPTSIAASSNGAAYISGSNGPQSTVVTATVYSGNDSFVGDPANVDNVQFTIAGPANNDGRLSAINAAGQQNTGNTVVAATHNGVATATFLTGTQQGPVQIKVTTDRTDNNVDNGISDPVSATTTVVVSDGKLFSLTIVSPDTGTAIATGVSPNAVETPAKSGNYQITISAKGVDRQGNAVLPGTVIAFGDIDSPQVPTGATGPQGWFQISGTHGDPQEGGKLFTATDGRFLTAGGGSGPGDTLLVIGKASEGAPALNDDLETADKITSVQTEGSLTVATPFNLNDKTGVIVNNGPVLPYIIGRATFSSVDSPAFTDTSTSTTGVATTTLNYPANAIGKAVAVWAQGTGTNTNTSPGLTDVVADVAVLVFPGAAAGAYITASPDPMPGNTQVFETVCYYDGNNRPIANYDISFAFNFTVANSTIGSGSADGVSNSGKFQHLTGPNGCVTVSIVTASVPPTKSNTDFPSITFSAGPINNNSTPTPVGAAAAATVTVPIIVSAAQLQVSCATGTANGSGGTVYDVGLHLVDSAGAGMPGQQIVATCNATPPGSITSVAPLITDASGNTTAQITVNPTGTVGRCVFQSASFPNLVASIDFTATGGNTCSGGFSPPPN